MNADDYPVTCSRCSHNSSMDIHYSQTHRAWLCLRCHLRRPPLRRQLELLFEAALEPMSRAEMARAVGRDPRYGQLTRELKRLESDGVLVHEDGRWQASGGGQHPATRAQLASDQPGAAL